MDERALAGIVLLGGGLVTYTAGVFVAYPGRAFALTAVMVGIALLAVAQRPGGETA